jgi:hypothetical protein
MKLIRLRHYNILPEAELAKSLLDSNGIKCLLQKDGLPGAGVALIQGADLFVDDKDKQKSEEILGQTSGNAAADSPIVLG